MKEQLKIAGAFIGVIVGAGFASGRELMLFFVNFGLWGLLGTLVSAALFTFLGMALAGLGSRLHATSHKDVVYAICGRYLGLFVDLLITFFMFGVTVVMLAGGGALLEQQFGIPALTGSVLVTLLVVAVVCLDVNKVIVLIGAVTPFLILAAIAIALYAVFTRDLSFAALDQVASQQESGARHWLLGAFLYVSYNVVAGAPMLAILGGAARGEKTAIWGGILGGAGLGGLMLIMSAGLLSRLDTVADLPMPMLSIASEVSPVLGVIMCVIIFGMIVNTAVGMLYSFVARLLPAGTRNFRLGSVAAGVAAFVCSLIGFISLVGQVYPFFGYLGFVVMLAVLIGWLRMGRIKRAVVA
ncbi:YkvI family membrane protein [Pseudomonas tussilaginis]|uniref:YkvI family membrane protein n=1 Tax=Pseudomonas sp. 5 TaxID=1619949 RepID=UPI0005EB77B7|nr:membrane protein [Pseudomonas sp. 5]KJK04672.1 membrane protein [Pseudomonas sp. 5]